MWPRRQQDASRSATAGGSTRQPPAQSLTARGVLRRPAGAPPAPPKAPVLTPKASAWTRRVAPNTRADAAKEVVTKEAIANRSKPDDAAWLLRAVEKKRERKKGGAKPEEREKAAAKKATGKRPRSTGGESESKQVRDKGLAAQSWKQRRQQWSAGAKHADAVAAASAAEQARAEQQQESFDRVFQEIFGSREQQASGVAGDTPRTFEDSDEDGAEQLSLDLPQPTGLAPTRSEDAASKEEEADAGQDGAWAFSSDSALCLDDFEAKGGDGAKREASRGADAAALARWKEEDASHAVSDNFVRLHMRKRFKGSSGKAKKLPAYLRGRDERAAAPRDLSESPAASRADDDGLDFIDECLRALAEAKAASSKPAATQAPEPPPPRCHHALASQQLVVKKRNQNHGRAFFACALGADEGRCDFFLWADDDPELALRELFSQPEDDASDAASDELVPLDTSRPASEQQEALLATLRLSFGHANFRPGQLWAVTRALEHRSSLLVLPTGAGKSLCFQLPALLLPGATLVISPLVALMREQFERLPPALKARSACLASSRTSSRRGTAAFVRDLLSGRLKLALLSPERAMGRGMQRLLAAAAPRLALVCVDEAHCVSEWSHHFRPSFLQLARVFRHAPCVLAMTATASRRVAADILSQLVSHQQQQQPPPPLDNPRRDAKDTRDADGMALRLPWQRSNLQLLVRRVETDEERVDLLLRFLAAERGAAIVYVHRQRQAEDLARVLTERLPGSKTAASRVGCYHAGLPAERREQTRLGFLRGRLRVVVATVAFGMGIDKPDVRAVAHFHLPSTAESYLQQVGRAGRDGKPATAMLLLADDDARLFRSLAFSHAIAPQQLQRLVDLVLLSTKELRQGSTDGVRDGYTEGVRDGYTEGVQCADEELRGSDRCAVTVAGGRGGGCWRTLDVVWAERALDMQAASVETFLALLAQRLPAHVTLLPASAARCRVQLSERQLRAQPPASLLQRLLRAASAAPAALATVEREESGYLRLVSIRFHVGAMAREVFGGDAQAQGGGEGEDEKEEEEEEEEEEDPVATRLLRSLQQARRDGLVQRVALEARAFRVRVQFPASTRAAEKRALARRVARELFTQHEQRQARGLARLARLYAALADAAAPADASAEELAAKARSLEQRLARYLDEDEDAQGEAEDAAAVARLDALLDPLAPATCKRLERDVRELLALSQRDMGGQGDKKKRWEEGRGEGEEERGGEEGGEDAPLPWTGASVARVLQGLASPAFPARRWREHPLWRAYERVAFEELARAAERVLAA